MGDAVKLKEALERVIRLKEAKAVLLDEASVTITVANGFGRVAKFCTDHDHVAKSAILVVVEDMLKFKKDAIRKKYDIDIK